MSRALRSWDLQGRREKHPLGLTLGAALVPEKRGGSLSLSCFLVYLVAKAFLLVPSRLAFSAFRGPSPHPPPLEGGPPRVETIEMHLAPVSQATVVLTFAKKVPLNPIQDFGNLR